jgi:hypothetical protein
LWVDFKCKSTGLLSCGKNGFKSHRRTFNDGIIRPNYGAGTRGGSIASGESLSILSTRQPFRPSASDVADPIMPAPIIMASNI